MLPFQVVDLIQYVLAKNSHVDVAPLHATKSFVKSWSCPLHLNLKRLGKPSRSNTSVAWI